MFRRMLRTTRYMYWTTSVTPRRLGFGLGSGLALAVPAGVLPSLPTYGLTYLPTEGLTYLRTDLPTCLRTTYLRTHLPTYVRTYSPSRRISAHGCSRGSSSPSPTCAWSSTRSRTRAARAGAEGNPGPVRSKDSIEERSIRSCTVVMHLCRFFAAPARRVFPDHLMTIAKRYLVIHLHCSRRLSGGQ